MIMSPRDKRVSNVLYQCQSIFEKNSLAQHKNSPRSQHSRQRCMSPASELLLQVLFEAKLFSQAPPPGKPFILKYLSSSEVEVAKLLRSDNDSVRRIGPWCHPIQLVFRLTSHQVKVLLTESTVCNLQYILLNTCISCPDHLPERWWRRCPPRCTSCTSPQCPYPPPGTCC